MQSYANRYRFVVLMGFAWAIVGCSATIDGQWLERSIGPGLVHHTGSPIPDVPAPAGFVLVPSRSTTDAGKGYRRVQHLYQGRATMADTIAYYRRLPRQKGWSPVLENSDGEHVFRYVKHNENLEIRLTHRQGVASAWVVIRPSPNARRAMANKKN